MEKIGEERVLAGERFDVHRMKLRGDDGKIYHREVLRHPGAVVLIPVLDDGRLVLIRNTRPTIDETLLELPAGTREPDEAPEVTAGRELIEETGYRASRLTLLREFYAAPGISDERMWLYVAEGLTEVGADREAVESIVNEVVSPAEATRLLEAGEIVDGKTLVGLLSWLSSSLAPRQ